MGKVKTHRKRPYPKRFEPPFSIINILQITKNPKFPNKNNLTVVNSTDLKYYMNR